MNTTAAVWLGSTIGCAQCHNHKYDPFSQKEYYQLMAFFANSARDTATSDSSNKGKEPVLDLATAEQEQTRRKLKAEIDALEARLKTQTPELARAQSGWERKLVEAVLDWKQIQKSSMNSVSGTTLTSTAEGAILASGKNPQRETFIIEGEVSLAKLTGIRLEALPHEQLPRVVPDEIPTATRSCPISNSRSKQPEETGSRYNSRVSCRTMAAHRMSAPGNFGSSMRRVKINAWPGNSWRYLRNR